MPAAILPGLQRLIFGASTDAVAGSSIGPSTSALGIVIRPAALYPASVSVRASGAYNTSLTSTETSAQYAYGALGMILFVDQSAVAASSAGGGTGTMTHTVQFQDPVSANYQNSTGTIAATTAVATFGLSVYPGAGTVAPTSGGIGSVDQGITGVWRLSSVASSSATNFTYSVGASYLPASGSSS